ncbi:baseplate J/gp47 family protein [Domibacillus tundrae]|uniref:baseplate J/gp47 family protein n=1 Tax=Domibacillus tundrae TaxID=1587527 RepID=UPI0006180DB0|nr:baseplate J/gp47 family protein [Domibacillus tundrae]
MFEQYTYETLLQEMIDDTDPVLDLSETSLLYMSYAKTAAKAAEQYRSLNRVLELTFAATSEGEYLKMRTAEMDVVAEVATPAVRSGTFNVAPALDSRFFANDLYFTVIQENPPLLECETVGVIGNTIPTGTVLLPLETIDGLTTAVLGDVMVLGQEAEEDTDLKIRYEERVTDPAASGNVAHYRQWAREVSGVGAVRIFPNWNGADTIRIVIVDAEYRPPTSVLVEQVQHYIDPVPGMGEGAAPAGAFVTVEAAVAFNVAVTAKLELTTETTAALVTEAFTAALKEYLKTLTFQEDVAPIIRYREVGALLLDIAGVVDYDNLLVNGLAVNIPFPQNESPIVGAVTFSV